MVGQEMIRVIAERNLEIKEFFPVASSRSVGKLISFAGKSVPVISIQQLIDEKPDIAIFSAGADTSLKWAEELAVSGTFVIDNSSAWRMKKHIPLVVPEINANAINKKTRIIANPNCSTIQMVLAIAPLHKKYIIYRIVVSTYQSVTGSGMKASKQLEDERRGLSPDMAYPHTIDLNLLPHGGNFTDNGYTTEEIKLENETRKILDDPGINVTATVVRVPVYGGHSESVNLEFEKAFNDNEIKIALESIPGITVIDDPQENKYPMPLYARGKDDVFVGRIRRDHSIKNGLNMWIVSDNLRKGAATNAVQIAEYIMNNGLID